MELLVVGLNHKTAPIEIRECLAFPKDKMEEALSKIQSLPSLKENIILSTCNRVEVYAATRETEKATHDLKEFLSQYHGIPLKEFEKNQWLSASLKSWARSKMLTTSPSRPRPPA
jgi:glutamyl-tRNA reductase